MRSTRIAPTLASARWTSTSPTSRSSSARRRASSPTARSSRARRRTRATRTSTSSSSAMLAAAGLPRRDRPARVRRRRPGPRDLRARRRGDRPRRQRDAHGRLRADLARLRLDPRLGQRGAEGDLPAAAVLGRVAGLLRADRARGRLGRREPAHARDEGRRRLGAARIEDVDLARQPREGRADLRPDRSRSCATAAWPAFSSTPTQPGFTHAADPSQDGPARLRHRVDRARRRLRRPTTACSAPSARASRSR